MCCAAARIACFSTDFRLAAGIVPRRIVGADGGLFSLLLFLSFLPLCDMPGAKSTKSNWRQSARLLEKEKEEVLRLTLLPTEEQAVAIHLQFMDRENARKGRVLSSPAVPFSDLAAEKIRKARRLLLPCVLPQSFQPHNDQSRLSV